MKKNYLKKLGKTLVLAMCLPAISGQSQTLTVQNFVYTGSTTTFTVPACVTSITVSARGGQGGTSGYTGGQAGQVNGVLTVTPGQVLYINVGGAGGMPTAGFNGGGVGGTSPASTGGGGGGGSDIRVGSNTVTARVLVAAGGGGSGGSTSYGATPGNGGGGSSCTTPLGVGGGGASGCAAGTSGGCAGGTAPSYGTGGAGGGLSSGGGQAGSSTGDFGGPGGLGFGGYGGSYTGATFCNGGGGGGGGYYGGSGGMSGSGGCNGGGGGGASYADANVVSSPVFQVASASGNGAITFTYNYMGPGVSAISSPTVLCSGSTATLQASGVSTYTWNNSVQTASQTVNPTSNTVYTVQGTNAFNCVSSVVFTLGVNPGPPTMTVTSSSNTLCVGQTLSLSVSGALSYSWTNSTLSGTGGTLMPTASTVYSVVGANACGTSTVTQSVTVAPLQVTTSAPSTVVCAGSQATLMASATATNYQWQPSSMFGATVLPSPTVTTVYTVTASDGTCTGLGYVTINVNPIPTIQATSSSTNLCVGYVATLTATGGTNYVWTPGNLSGATITVSPSSSLSYMVVGSNSFGCTSSAQQIVVVSPSPTITATASNSLICLGGSSTLTASGANTYTWASANTNTIAVTPGQSTSYTVSGSSANGCISSGVVNVDVFNPTVSITGNTAVCSGNAATLTASGGADTYNWLPINLPFQGITISPSVTTTFTVEITSTTLNVTCSNSAVFQVLVNPNPTVTATADRTVMCKGENVTISASGANSYSWSTTASTASFVLTPSLITNYIMSVTGTDNNGCIGTSTVTVKVNGCVGLADNSLENVFSMFPNPSSGEITLTAQSALNVQIFAVNGQQVRSVELNSENNYSSKVTGLASGVYFVKDSVGAGKAHKLIIE